MGNQDDIKNKDYSVTTAIWIAAALLAADVYENNPNASDMDYYFKQTDIQALAQRFTDKDVHPARISQWTCADAEDHTYNYLRSAGGEGSSFRRLTNPAEMDGYRTLPEDVDINADDSKFMSDNHSYTLEELFRFAKEKYPVGRSSNAWLLTWNPKNWEWEDFERKSAESKTGITFTESWTCQSKQPKTGDDVFLIKLGDRPRGIIAHGNVVRASYEAPHYDPKLAEAGKKTNHIDVEFDWIQNYQTEPFLLQEDLQQEYPDQHWSPNASGIEIKGVARDGVEELWSRLIQKEWKWFPPLDKYDPKISKEDWLVLFPDLLIPEWSSVLAMFYTEKDGATCADLENKFGMKYSIILGRCNQLARKIKTMTDCPLYMENGKEKFWPVLFQRCDADNTHRDIYIWRLRPELYEALTEYNILEYLPEEKGDGEMTEGNRFDHNLILYGPPGTGKTYYTVIYAVAIIDGRSVLEVGKQPYEETLSRYQELKKSGQIALTTFHQSYGYEEFIEGIKPNLDGSTNTIQYTIEDGIFKSFCQKAGRVEVTSDQFHIAEDAMVWKVTIRDNVLQDCYDHNRVRINWVAGTEGANGFANDMKKGDIILTTNKSRTMINGIAVILDDDAFTIDTKEDSNGRNVHWLAKNLKEDIRPINHEKQLHRMTVARVPDMSVEDVLSLAREKNPDLQSTKFVQNKDRYVFVIDEINRGNISKIFGELITLIEDTKRRGANEQMEAVLPYSKIPFSVPANVYLLGTMNTADRSIALMDTALRRRFRFIEMMPDPEVLENLGIAVINIDGEEVDVKKMLKVINQRIEYLYDREHTIGHAFFTSLAENPSLDTLSAIFEKNIIPLLQEYFYEDYEKIQLILGDNDKEDEYKFILDRPVKVKEIFRGNPDIDLPEKVHTIQRDALRKVTSYQLIYMDMLK